MIHLSNYFVSVDVWKSYYDNVAQILEGLYLCLIDKLLLFCFVE